MTVTMPQRQPFDLAFNTELKQDVHRSSTFQRMLEDLSATVPVN